MFRMTRFCIILVNYGVACSSAGSTIAGFSIATSVIASIAASVTASISTITATITPPPPTGAAMQLSGSCEGTLLWCS